MDEEQMPHAEEGLKDRARALLDEAKGWRNNKWSWLNLGSLGVVVGAPMTSIGISLGETGWTIAGATLTTMGLMATGVGGYAEWKVNSLFNKLMETRAARKLSDKNNDK